MVIELTDGDSDEVESKSDEVMSDGKRFCIWRVSRVYSDSVAYLLIYFALAA